MIDKAYLLGVNTKGLEFAEQDTDAVERNQYPVDALPVFRQKKELTTSTGKIKINRLVELVDGRQGGKNQNCLSGI